MAPPKLRASAVLLTLAFGLCMAVPEIGSPKQLALKIIGEKLKGNQHPVATEEDREA